jgi:hypothetical protein
VVSPTSLLLAVRRGALPLIVLAAACTRGGDDDGALTRDLALASSSAIRPATDSVTFADTSLASRTQVAAAPTPAPTPVPVVRRVASVEREPRPAPAASEPEPAAAPATVAVESAPAAVPAAPPAVATTAGTGSGRSVGAGAGLALSLQSTVCSGTNHPGDRFVATLTQAVNGENGLVVLPVGTSVVMELVAATTPATGRGHMELVVRGVSVDGFYRNVGAEVADVDTLLQRRRYQVPGSSDKGKIGRGAMTGAILGRVLGGRGAKGTVIGAAAGAAVGAAGAVGSSQWEGCLVTGAPIRVRLTETLRVE